ncbi:hypothetical protein FRC07_007897, partial [Ceratobasidium sp. 392]
LADTIANPADNPELFEEGWDAALAKEAGRDDERHEAAVPNGAATEDEPAADGQEESEQKYDA